jgi:hypothetical protein
VSIQTIHRYQYFQKIFKNDLNIWVDFAGITH